MNHKSWVSSALLLIPLSVSAYGAQTGVWTNVTPSFITLGDFGYGTILVNAKRTSDFYMGSGNGGVIKSTDYGATWSLLNETHGHFGFGISPTEPVTILMGSGYNNGSCLRSIDGGISFQTVGGGLGSDPYNFVVDPYDPGHILIGLHETDGIAESNDTGRTFHMISSGGTPGWPSGGKSWFPFFINTGDSAKTHGSWLAIAQDGASVCLTSNRGANWTVPSSIQGLQHPHGGAQIFQTGSTVYVSGIGGPNGQGVYRSTDLGSTWARVDNGNTPQAIVWGSATKVYSMWGWACSHCNTGTMFETADMANPTSWNSPSVPTELIIGPQSVGVAFDGTNTIFVGSMWAEGIWRYVEPASTTALAAAVKTDPVPPSSVVKVKMSMHPGTQKLVIASKHGLNDITGRNVQVR